MTQTAKITETFADKVANGRGPGRPRKMITVEHEPTTENPTWVSPPPVTFQAPPPPLITPAEKQPLKVAIVGTAPSSRLLAPFNDPSWQIWVCSPGNMNTVPRVDVWFEIHNNLTWPENQHYGLPYLDWQTRQNYYRRLEYYRLIRFCSGLSA